MAFPFQVPHGWMHGLTFALKETLPAIPSDSDSTEIPAGTVVKVVMVSGMGDCGITTALWREVGYTHRVDPHQLAKLPDVEYPTKSDLTGNQKQEPMFVRCYLKDIVPWDHTVLEDEP